MGRNSGGGGRTRRPVGGGGALTGNAAGEQAAGRLGDLPKAPATSRLVPPAAAPARTAGILTNTRRNEDEFGRVTYSFNTTEGDQVRMTVGTTGSITFKVNESYSRGTGVSGDAANAITLRLMRQIREDARSRPEGFEYHAGAATIDGYGPQRAIAYQAIGMSRPTQAEPGNPQYATVRGGKLTPNDDALRAEEGGNYRLYNNQWDQIKSSNRRVR